MTTAAAKEILLLHSFAHPDLKHPKIENGFLGSLRPYRGHLIDDNFHEVMGVLRVLAPSLQQPSVDSEVVSALWNICDLARAWGLHPNGMLQRNKLIGTTDIHKLEEWVGCLSYAVSTLLGGGSNNEAFHEYDYKKSQHADGTHHG